MNPSITAKSTIGPLRWAVPSATTKGITYEVAADAETTELRCDCPNGQAGKCNCWHIKAVRTGLAGKPRVRLTQRSTASRTHAAPSNETRNALASLDV